LLRLRHLKLLVSARRLSLERISKVRTGNILVLCYGNIYRSPFVERRLRACLGETWQLRSAGFHQKIGRPCEPDYIPIAAQYGADLITHRSRFVSHDDIDWADLVIIMDRKNHDQLAETYPDSLDKVVWVAAALGGLVPEVDDPYGKTHNQVERLVRRMDESVAALCALLNTD